MGTYTHSLNETSNAKGVAREAPLSVTHTIINKQFIKGKIQKKLIIDQVSIIESIKDTTCFNKSSCLS